MKEKMKFFKTNIFYYVIVMLILFAISKYIKEGELYTFETTPVDEVKTEILLDQEIVKQDIVIGANAAWKNGSYSIKIDKKENTVENIKMTLKQELYSDTTEISLINVNSEEYFNVSDYLDFSKLKEGIATLSIEAIDTGTAIGILTTKDYYNLGKAYKNNVELDEALIQKYSYFSHNIEYTLRIVLFFIMSCLMCIMFYLIANKKETRYLCYCTQGFLIVIFICLNYIFNSSLFFEPTWAEAVTNFSSNAIQESFIYNFSISDAGYLPLTQRIISVCLIQILGLNVKYALVIMQVIAYLISGFIFSFFVNIAFNNIMKLIDRSLICVLLMIQLIDFGAGVFINFICYGIIIIVLFMISNDERWNKTEYMIITIFSSLVCLSKGQYVIVLPVMLVCLLLFNKYYTKRKKVFAISLIFASFGQIIYSFSNSGNGVAWINTAGNSNKGQYIVKIILESMRDFANYFFSILSNKIAVINSISFFLTLLIIGYFSYFSIKRVIYPWIKKKNIERNSQNLFTCILFSSASIVLFRITVLKQNDQKILSKDFWNFIEQNVGGRYEIFCYSPLIIIIILTISSFSKYRVRIDSEDRSITFDKLFLYLMVGFFFIFQPRLEFDYPGDYTASIDRYYTTNMNSEYLLTEYMKEDGIVVPITPEGWIYQLNSKIFYVGENIYNWNAQKLGDIYKNRPVSKIYLGDIVGYNSNGKVTQLFAERKCLIKDERYTVVLKDKKGNIIEKQREIAKRNKKLLSFYFKNPVSEINEIEFYNDLGEQVYVNSNIYLVTRENDDLQQENILDYTLENVSNVVNSYQSIIEQEFTATTDKITGISLMIGTYGRELNYDVDVTLLDHYENIVSAASFNAKDLLDNQWHNIKLQETTCKLGEQYKLRIESHEPDKFNSLGIYVGNTVKNDIKNIFRVNGIEQSNQLAIKIYGYSK